tara:strand:- start:30544 stop:30960 length:417 start_codon:yes stop_codon:yes gene_type:complete
MASILLPSFSERLKPFSKKIDKETGQRLPPEYSETSYLGLRPGDLIQVTYEGVARYGLILSSRTTKSGIFISTRNNALVNFIGVSGLSEAMFSLMINNLYNNENACSIMSSTVAVFIGKTNFRTLNQAKMKDILKVYI